MTPEQQKAALAILEAWDQSPRARRAVGQAVGGQRISVAISHFARLMREQGRRDTDEMAKHGRVE